MLTGKHIILGMVKNEELTLSEFSRMGGKARARIYDKAQLSEWARMGAAARWKKQQPGAKGVQSDASLQANVREKGK